MFIEDFAADEQNMGNNVCASIGVHTIICVYLLLKYVMNNTTTGNFTEILKEIIGCLGLHFGVIGM